MPTTAIRNMAAIGCAAAALVSAPAMAGSQAAGTFQISATVPMACWVDHAVEADAMSPADGRVTEACNSASGYVVSAMYRPLDPSEHARLIYGDRMFDLSSAGEQEVHRAHGPRIQQVVYRFDEVRLEAPLTLSLTIQPI